MDHIILIELIFVAVVTLGIGLWQLWDVNRQLGKDRDDKASADDAEDRR